MRWWTCLSRRAKGAGWRWRRAGAAEQRLRLRYVVCLMLLRRRLLTQEGRKGRVLLVRHKGTARPPEGPALIEVVDPDVDEGTLLEILGQLEGFGGADGGGGAGGAGAGGGGEAERA